jgi:hypothetical protein
MSDIEARLAALEERVEARLAALEERVATLAADILSIDDEIVDDDEIMDEDEVDDDDDDEGIVDEDCKKFLFYSTDETSYYLTTNKDGRAVVGASQNESDDMDDFVFSLSKFYAMADDDLKCALETIMGEFLSNRATP